MPAYQLKTLKGQDQDAILQKMHSESYFFSATHEQLAKHFLGNFIDGRLFNMPFAEIRKKVVAQVHDPSIIPAEEGSFYRFVCQTYIDLEKLPSAVMLEYFRTAIEDLQAIESRLKDYDMQTKEITEKESSLKTEEDTYQLRILNHYAAANDSAHQEILDFLYYRLKDYTIFNCTGRPWMISLIYGGIPYSFRFISKQLDWKSLSDLSNKFGQLTLEEFYQLKQYYDDKKDDDFYAGVRKYLKDYDIIEKIKLMIQSNHRLDARSRIFNEAFDAYARGSKYIFCSVIALQIEGLFSDYCLELGIDETSIRGSSLTDKVRMATSRNRRYQNFEYYAFRFPLIRNQIAHGNKITTDIENLADYLLLDLYDVCFSLTSPTLPVNKVVSILRSWDHNRTSHKLQVKYCLYREQEIPPFYTLDGIKIEIMEAIIQRPYWDYMLNLIHTGQTTLQKGVLRIITSLKKSAINEPWCKELLSYLPAVTIEGFEENQFFEELEAVDPSR